MKELAKDLLPPMLLRVLNKVRSPKAKEYETFDAALMDCQSNPYQADEIVQVVVEKNIRFRESLRSNSHLEQGTLRTLIALGPSNVRGCLNVVDFGGGAGYHHTIARKVLGDRFPLRWNVVETPAMSNAAKKMEGDGLKFFDDLDAAVAHLGTVDLIFASSSLQYCPDPLCFINRFTSIGASNIFITRTPLAESYSSVVSRQTSKLSSNGPGPMPISFDDKLVSFPITFASRVEVENTLNEKYQIRFTIDEGDGGFEVAGRKMGMRGYFCVRRD